MANERDDDLSSDAHLSSIPEIDLSEDINNLSKDIEEARTERKHRRWFRLFSFGFGWTIVIVAYCQAYGFVDNLAVHLTPAQLTSAAADPRQAIPSGLNAATDTTTQTKQSAPVQDATRTKVKPTETRHIFADLTPLLVTTLVLLFLLPTSITVALLRFSFSNGNDKGDEKGSPSITTPSLETLKEFLSEIRAWFKRG
ncbi:hypothetical protein KQ940_10070 [Marinobacterium sp. D7]|uniref:hypothetical protein n=1 Tax=Marinobacterium ramblicola TaxID=2849041 RepID=UPI001C2CF1F1|nr:hypothetical protein [Marinobacterium ramblicola]MBV1788402.1 hypothetical protein [Marinobacterium ramblicola]